MEIAKRLHSYLAPSCVIKRNPLGEMGVFAEQRIAEGELISVWGGKIYTEAEIDDLSETRPEFATHPVSVYPGFYLGSTELERLDEAEMFNHSCEPNAGVRGQILVVARRQIEPGEEITFDYDTTEIDSIPFECSCGSTCCRGTINGSGWKDPEFRRRNAGFFSTYVQDLIDGEDR
ncbi:MAG: SET domain-containing protein-lysine N-methyltransferase [Verrucomicrobiota bacterium]